MHVVEEALDVHGGPCKRADTGSQPTLQVINMWGKQRTSIRPDFVDNSYALTNNILELVVVVFELVLLQQYNLSRLRNLDANTCKTLGLSDESEDLTVEVDIQFKILVMTDEESCLETSLCTINFFLPLLTPHVLIREESIT
jgi:hypothetical protein